MAKLNEEMVVIKISKLLRDDEKASAMLDAEMSANLEAVIQELAGPDKLVEVIKEQAMAAITTTTLLATTSHGTSTGNYDGSATAFNSDKVKGDGYYGFADGVHTLQTRITAFIGTIKIQASLATTPADADYVDIATIVTGDGSSAITQGYLTNFTGNYVWIRVAVSDFTSGTINTILLGH